MRFILLEFDSIAKMPREVEVIKIRRPRRFERKRFTRRRIAITMRERVL